MATLKSTLPYLSCSDKEALAEKFDVDHDVVDSYSKYLKRQYDKNMKAKFGRTAFNDSQRQKTYDAENIFTDKFGKMGRIDQETAQTFAEHIFHSSEWKEFRDGRSATTIPPVITFRKMPSFAGRAYHNRITLCREEGNNLYILLHELAHTAGHRHHDVAFRRCLVAFVGYFNKKLSRELKKVFREHGLKMTVPAHKEPKDFETWYKKYKHMKMVREHR